MINSRDESRLITLSENFEILYCRQPKSANSSWSYKIPSRRKILIQRLLPFINEQFHYNERYFNVNLWKHVFVDESPASYCPLQCSFLNRVTLPAITAWSEKQQTRFRVKCSRLFFLVSTLRIQHLRLLRALGTCSSHMQVSRCRYLPEGRIQQRHVKSGGWGLRRCRLRGFYVRL